MTLSQQIRELLLDGPATAREIALELGIAPVRAKVGLWVLKKQHHIEASGTVPNLEYGRGQHRELNLYGLTTRGETWARMTRRERAA